MGIRKKILPTFERVPCKAPKMATLSAGYQPGVTQPYSKWSTDRDEVQVDYDQLNSRKRHKTCFSGRKGSVLKVMVILVVFFVGLMIGYVIRRSIHERFISPFQCSYSDGYERYSKDLSDELQKSISVGSLEENLRSYTSTVHLSGCHDNNLLGLHLRQTLAAMGLPTSSATYEVLMSFPDWMSPNSISLINTTGDVIYSAVYQEKHFHPELDPFSAYAPNGTVQADLVYANYGEESDFQMLQHNNVSVEGKIVILRYGKMMPKNKVEMATLKGAVGVILYADPADHIDPLHHIQIYPSGPNLPGWAVKRSTVLPYLTGDPLTPGLPSIRGVYRIDERDASLPKTPVQPVSYDQANLLLSHLGGSIIDRSFIGGLNVSYQSGPGYAEPRDQWKVKMEINNEKMLKNITNVFAYINGEMEPDRYVIIGCHFDAWTYGGSDSSGGTAILMEVTKAFNDLVKRGWKPRRTIIFAHWDGGVQSMAGSYEWIQEHFHELSERIVVYINLDSAVSGNYTFAPKGSPMIRGLIKDISKRVMSPTPDIDQSEQSIYNNWLLKNYAEGDINTLSFPLLGDGSDSSGFAFTLGVTCVDLKYIGQETNSPFQSTSIDNFNTTSQFVDPGFKTHQSLGRLTVELVLRLSSQTHLPFDPREIGHTLALAFDEVHPIATQQGANEGVVAQFNHLSDAIGNFSEAAERFVQYYNDVPDQQVLRLRHLTDRLLHLPRVFLLPEGLPDRSQYKNILYGPSHDVGYTASTFPAIRDWARKGSTSDLLRHISIATVAVQSASHILRTNMFEGDHFVPPTPGTDEI